MRTPAYSRTPPWWARSVAFPGRYLNLHEIGRRLGVSHSYLSKLITGQRNLSPIRAQEIAGILDMSTDEFLVALNEHVKKSKTIR
jgi:transcriptional regulator with XRE-family HTH domain